MKRLTLTVWISVLTLLALAGCRESRSPTDPGPLIPPSSGTYALYGTIYEAGALSSPLGQARIEIRDAASAGGSAISDANGRFRVEGLSLGFYTIEISLDGFVTLQNTMTLGGAVHEARRDFELSRQGVDRATYEVFGMVWVKGGEGRSAYVDAKVEVLDGPEAGLTAMSDEMGMYSLKGVRPGTLQIRASRGGASETKTVTLAGGAPTIFIDFSI